MLSYDYLLSDISTIKGVGTKIRKLFRKKNINTIFDLLWNLPRDFVDRSNVDGIDSDLILRPFIQKGVIASLRDFSNISMNHHHGMQSEELAGFNSDLDRDGIVNELTEGDMPELK